MRNALVLSLFASLLAVPAALAQDHEAKPPEAQAPSQGQAKKPASQAQAGGQAAQGGASDTVPGAGPNTPPYAVKVQAGIRKVLAQDLDGAVATFRQAIEMDPNAPQAHYFMGAALRAKGQLKEAVESFQTAARMAQGDPAWQARGLFVAAMTLEQLAAQRIELPQGDQLTPETPRINEPALERAREAWNRVKQVTQNGAPVVSTNLVDQHIQAIDKLEQTEKQTVDVRKRIAEREKKKAEDEAEEAKKARRGHH